MKELIKKQRAFTLVELLVTVAITSILTTVVVVGYMNFLNKAAIATDEYLASQINRLIAGHRVFEKVEDENEIANVLKPNINPDVDIQTMKLDMNIYYNTDDKEFQVLKDVEAVGYENLHYYLRLEQNSDAPDTESDIDNNNDLSNTQPQKKYNIKEQYVISENQYECNLEMSFYYDPESQSYVYIQELDLFSLSNLIDLVEDESSFDITYELTTLSEVKYQNLHYSETVITPNNQVKFNYPGKYQIIISDGYYYDTVIVNVININVNYLDPILSDNTSTLTTKYNGKLYLNLLNSFRITDYIWENSDYVRDALSASDFFETQSSIITIDNRLIVELNGETIDLVNIENQFCIYIENTLNEINLTYHYQGLNGKWVTLEQTYRVNINSTEDNNKNITLELVK